jgi:hypothetical protein
MNEYKNNKVIPHINQLITPNTLLPFRLVSERKRL